jgi:hypothetical protein
MPCALTRLAAVAASVKFDFFDADLAINNLGGSFAAESLCGQITPGGALKNETNNCSAEMIRYASLGQVFDANNSNVLTKIDLIVTNTSEYVYRPESVGRNGKDGVFGNFNMPSNGGNTLDLQFRFV